jgi:hypothetical protein
MKSINIENNINNNNENQYLSISMEGNEMCVMAIIIIMKK